VNIKNLIGNVNQVTAPPAAAKTDRMIKTDNTQDRDANGQQLYFKERKKEKMTEEQFQKAVAILSEKHFIKDMNWTVSALE
jgi:ribosomal protein L12E/L44/L45/RPP1/RPP2